MALELGLSLPLARLATPLQADMAGVQARLDEDQRQRERALQELAAQDQLAAEVGDS